jgi:hypothetical protein
MTILTINDLTTTTLDGGGMFDVLMRANKVHLEAEFKANRIKGPEYSAVYLGALQAVMATSMAFLLQKDKNALETQLLELQVQLSNIELLKATSQLAQIAAQTSQIEVQTALVTAQIANTAAELAILQANVLKVPAEIAQLTAQTAVTTQQKLNLVDELLTSASQRTKLAEETAQVIAQTTLVTQQKSNLTAEAINIPKQGLKMDADTAVSAQQKLNLAEQALNIPKEGLVLNGQKCKLDAEFDLLKQELLKSTQETGLLAQKTATERGQTSDFGVSDNSVIGKQKALYAAQTSGFARDAEQKVAKLMTDTWNVRRTTDETGTVADATNKLDDVTIGRVITKMLDGVGA